MPLSLEEALRVDSENFSVGPVERILGRFPDAAAVAVVGVPDPLAGDQILLVIEPLNHQFFDPLAFASFLDEQPDLGTKWAPRFVRVMCELPVISQGKIDKKAASARRLALRRPPLVAAAEVVDLCPDDQR